MKTQDIKNIASAYMQVQEKAKMDPVNPDELKGTHAQRKDKDIDNDGDVDKSDEYLHNRRKAVKTAMKNEADQKKIDTSDMGKWYDKNYPSKKSMKKEEVEELGEGAYDKTVTVNKKKHSWGTVMNVKHGNASYSLHPDHQKKIKGLYHGDKTSFNNEDGVKITAHREGDKIHLSHPHHYSKTTIDRSHFNESVNLDEDISKMSHARLKWHMNTGVPHGSYTKDEMKKEKERRMKHADSADAYKKAKPALEDTNMNESRWPILQRIMERQNHGNMDNGSPRGEGLSPSAKAELARSEGDSGIDGVKAAADTARNAVAQVKVAPKRPGDKTDGDKTMPKNDGK